MRPLLVTGSDTGVGKTWCAGELAARLAAAAVPVEIVKVVETGAGAGGGDAALASARAGGVPHRTLFRFAAPLAPAAAAEREGRPLRLAEVAAACGALPQGRGWRIFEGAGGIATPLELGPADWADLAAAAGWEEIIIVVPDRLGAINQARLCAGRAAEAGLSAAIWLNRLAPVAEDVAASTRTGLLAAGVRLFDPVEFVRRAKSLSDAGCTHQPGAAEVRGGGLPLAVPGASGGDAASTGTEADWRRRPAAFPAGGTAPAAESAGGVVQARLETALAERERRGRRRVLSAREFGPDVLHLADNDYLDLARDPAVAAAAAAAAQRHGTSASASPLVTGWRQPHESLVRVLAGWQGFAAGLLWTSGYAANAAVLGGLPRPGDLVLADRLVHASMIAGLTRSGARFRRYPHLDLGRLESELRAWTGPGSVFVATESVFSMDGDAPDLRALAALKRVYGFTLILDEAHAVGWYGSDGAGLASELGMSDAVDIFVGTLGKTLASGGAFTLFHDPLWRDTLVNEAGEFIYSTALPPPAAAAAEAAVERVRALAASGAGAAARERSRRFRAGLRADGWQVPEGDSPIVPLVLGEEGRALAAARFLETEGIVAAAIRPPTVPAGSSRLRFSLKRTTDDAVLERVRSALRRWRDGGLRA